MNFIVLGLDLYFAAMLGISGLAKLENLDHFAGTLRRHRILPAWSIALSSRIVPWLEVLTALSLIVGALNILTSVITLLLFASFLVTEMILVATKRATDCGCYGMAYPQKVDRASIVVSTVLVMFAGFHLWLVTWVNPISLIWRVPVIVIFFGMGVWLVWKMVTRHRLNHARLATWNRILQSDHPERI